MKKLSAILLSCCFAVSMAALCACNNNSSNNEGGKPEERVDKEYICKFTSEESVEGNGYNKDYVKIRSSLYSFYQTDTLLLKADDTYKLRKQLSTSNDAEDKAKVNIYFDFEGSYTESSNKCTLIKPLKAQAHIDWGTINVGYETGDFDSNSRKGLLYYFTTGFIGDNCRYENMNVTLTDDAKFTFEVSGLEKSNKNGNADTYNIGNVAASEEQYLKNKNIYWLGSSVTYGSASEQITMVDYIQKKQEATCVKEAVSGTTLCGKTLTTSDNSYVSRLVNSTKFDKSDTIDAFMCQISTNDVNSASRVANWGTITADDKKSLEDFDYSTTLGAVEYIICYVQKTWNCPIVFWSGTEYGGENGYNYGLLIKEIKKLEQKWGIKVLDMYNDSQMNSLPLEYYHFYMSDPVHPKKAGYLEWWTPKFEEYLKSVLNIGE